LKAKYKVINYSTWKRKAILHTHTEDLYLIVI